MKTPDKGKPWTTNARPLLLLAGLLTPVAPWAATDFSGYFEVGVREVDVQGDGAKYDQYIKLDDGARLFGMGFRFAPEDPDGRAPDLVDVHLAGFGGEPHESAAVTVKKYGAYRFRYNRHRSEYFYADVLLRPQDASVEQSTGGDFHHFDFERTRDDASLGIDLGERAKVTFDFDRYEKHGESTTTADVEREEFDLEQPIDERRRSSTLGFQYAWDRVTLTASESWQHHDDDRSWFLPGFSAGTEPAEPTQLDFFGLDQPYRQDVREHAIGLRARPSDKLTLNVDLRDIDLDMDLDVAERSQGIDFTGTPFARDLTGGGKVQRDTALLSAGANYALTERLQIEANVRRYTLDQDGAVSFDNTASITEWEIDNTGFELAARATLTDAIHVAAGWHTETRDSEFVETDNGSTTRRAEDTDHSGFYLQATYQPDPRLRLTLSAENNRIDDPFTLASATDSQRIRLRGHYRFDNGLRLTGSHQRTAYENDNSDWESTTDQTDLRLSFSTARLTLSAGFGLIELEREIDQLVTAGFRRDLFAIRYQADATFWDGAADFEVNDKLRVSASLRQYDNDGSFDVERDDAELALGYTLPQNYVLKLRYRNVDYSEGDLEAFDADIWELSVQYAW